jgi:hypothetical protein
LRRLWRIPDALWTGDVPEELVKELEARNLILYNMYYREPQLLDRPAAPREKSRTRHRADTWHGILRFTEKR